MSRTAVYTALVLRNHPSGESNCELTLLTAEEGIIRAIVYGGAKSKLRAHSAPYNSGQVWIYRSAARDKSRDYAKLSDFDVKSWRPGLRELYDRTMTAGAIAETILSSHGGGGEWAEALELAVKTLDALENANEELCGRLLIHFLWRWAHLLGIRPYLESCAACSQAINDSVLFFNAQESHVFCASCAPENGINNIKLNPGCRKWLLAAESLEAAQVYRYSMDNKSFTEAKALVTAVISSAIGKRPASWDW